MVIDYPCCRENEEDLSVEHLVGNPIYNDSPLGAGENRASETESYDVLHHNVGTIGVIGAYELITNLPTQPSRANDAHEASAYAKPGADSEGISENAESGVNDDSEFRSPYATISESDM